MAGRNAQISRIYAILDLLEGAPHGLTVGELKAKLEDRDHHASKRTVYRDLEALSAAGFPLFPNEDSENAQASRWILERNAKINQYLVLAPRELVALYLAQGVLSPLKDTPFYEDLNGVFRKIEEKIGTRGQEFLSELTNELRFEPGPRWGLGLNPDTLETIRAACAERQILQFHYSSVSSGTRRTRTVGPHYLYFAKSSLYLVGEDLEDSKVKVFSVPRINDATMLDKPYEGKVQTPEEFFQHSFGIFHGSRPTSVEIQFSPTVAPFVRERRWHPSQRVVSKADSSIILHLEVAVTPDLVQWILSFGPEAKVISGGDLQQRIFESAQKVMLHYGEKSAA